PMRQEYRAYFYTDRRIYRPGQKVYFKGIVRRDQDAQYALPSANTPVEITARDNQGREFWKQTLRISDMGTIDGEIQLAESAPLGFYQLQGRLGEQFFGTDFQVAEYRRPEFQVSVTLDKNDYINGSTIKAIAEAGYFFGGPVAEAQVFWRVLSEPYYFDRWQGKGYYSFTEPEEDGFQPRLSPFGGLVAEGRGKTDAEGRFRFSLPADISEHKLSRRYTVEVSVVDLNNQEVSARSGAIVHKGNFYIGLAALRYVGTVGQEMPVQAITVDTRGITRTQQTLETVFYRHEWFSVREQADDGNFYWTTQVRDTPLVTKTVTTDAQGQATASFVPPEGGTYKVVAYGQDEFGNEVRSALFLWVSDRAFVHWGQRNDDRITLVADQKAYRPGDTAKILVPSPYQGETLALLTLERGSILEQRLIRLASNSEILELPIKPEYAPNVFISVTLVRGMQNDELPGFKMGYVMLPVSTEQKELQITLTSDRARYKPRDEAVFTIETRDYQGQGVPAEVSLQLVDLAIESLVGGAQTNILETFYRQRGLGVQSATTLAVLVDRQNLQTAQEGKGGGGGGEGEGLVRQEFPETAYWAPAVRTDASGRAQVTVRLPDTLTTWRMTAQAVTADTKVGVQRADITTTLEVLVRPVAPRFLVIGDKPVLGAIAHNNTDRTLEMTVTAQAQGVALERNEQTVTVPAGGQVKTAWPGVVQAVSEAILELRVSGGGHQDALRLTLPVYPPSAPEVVGTSGQVEGSVLEVVHVPEGADLTQGELKVTLEPSLAAGMSEGLGYLRAFPYDCIEQTVSRFLPNVVTYRAMRELGIENPKLAAQLPQQVGVALQRLYELQNPDGGWGWWARGESSPALTAYVILGLHEARRSDFAVDQQVVDRGVSFLYNWLDGKAPDTRRYRDERATVLYMLAEAGGAEYGDLGRTVALYEKRGDMSLYAKAYLAMALHILDADETTRRQTLVNELMDAAIVSAAGAHWEEPERGYWDMNTDARTTAIVLRALVRLSPENALLPNAVRWLMAARESGRWETTQENVWAILALTDYMVATGELQADYRYELWVNDSRLATGETAPENIDEVIQVKVPMDKLRAKAPNLLRISRAAKGQQDMTGKLYYSAFLRYFLPAERIQALDRGIVVYRNYYRMEDVGTEKDPRALAPGAEPIEAAQVGDTILVRLTLIAPNDLYFLVLEDPLPAGCEAIDTSLQTTASTTFGPQMEREKEEGSSGSYRHDWYYYWATHAELHD
ncbi:MAG: hypothetical protein H5T69_15155, partial [Chloroflexi bacterium]|nr:hypothetical protein [Chloroflexota bacterium]